MRNLPVNRQWFINAEEVNLLRHVLWWLTRSRRSEELLVVQFAGNRVGYVRLAPSFDGFTALSIAVDPRYQGQGLGRLAIREAVELAPDLLVPRGWHAFIRRDNFASLSAFAAVGFELDEGTNGASSDFVLLKLASAQTRTTRESDPEPREGP